MVHHIVVWQLKKSLSGEERENALDALIKAAVVLKSIPGVESFDLSCNIHPRTTLTADLLLHSTHASQEQLDLYYEHPVHVAFVDHIKDIVESRERLDFVVD